MPLRHREIEAFLRDGPGDRRVVLVYGPNEGLVRERADAVARHVVEDLSDPFLVVDLTGKDIADDPGRLANEVAAIPMMGGRRLIRLRDVNDTVAPQVAHVADDAPGDALTIVTAGDLPPRSSLRKLGDSLAGMVAIPCYADDGRDVRRLVEEILGRHRVDTTPDVVAWLIDHLGADRSLTRNELEKLALFTGDGKTLDLEGAMACIGDSAALSVEDLVYATGDGNLPAVDRDYARALHNGVAAFSVLRASSRHFMRLRQVRRCVDGGERLDTALDGLKPPVFFKYKDRFDRQARSWSLADIDRVLGLLMETERQCKTGAALADAFCGRALLQIAQLARRNALQRPSRATA